MDLVFDIASSVEFWRTVYPAERKLQLPDHTEIHDCAFLASDVKRLLPAWANREFLDRADGRAHVMVFDANQRRRSTEHATHIWTGPIPDGSFYRLDESTLIASPAFMFLSAASRLSLPALIAFGCELCGRYSFDDREERGFRTRSTPLSTPEQLHVFLEGAHCCRGYRTASRALPYLVPDSASPMETFDALALHLPYRLGGYGFDKPAMNHAVELSDKAARIAKRKTCYADMYYTSSRHPDSKLDIEHHGRLDHSSFEDRASDRARVNGLKEMGFEVIELTKDQVNDLLAFEYIIQRIAELLGRRLKEDKLGPTPARLEFRKEVFAWNRSGGQLW